MPTTPSAATITKVRGALTTEPQTASAIAKAVKLSDSTVRRTLTRLVTEGYAQVDEKSGGWLSEVGLNGDAEAPAKAPAAKAPAAKKAPAKSAADRLSATLAADKAKATAVPGYELRWPHGAYDLYKRTEKASEGSPQWTVRCAAHGTTTTADDVKAADALGRRSDRPSWCKQCAKPAATKAPAKATKAPAKKASAAKATKATKQPPTEGLATLLPMTRKAAK